MNVLRVIANMNPSSGGPCQGIRNSIPEMKVLGINNEVVSLDNPAATYLKEDDFPVYALGEGIRPWYYNAKLVPWLLKNLGRFDVVIVHGLWLYSSYAALTAIRVFRKRHKKTPRFYVMPHGMLDPYFQEVPGRRLKALRNKIYWKFFEGKVIHEADGLLFTSEAELRLARKPFRPYRPKKEINVGYGIAAPPSYRPSMLEAFLRKCPRLGEHPYLLFLGRIHEKKGVDMLIDAYTLLKKASIEDGREIPKLVIAGPGLDTTYGLKMQHKVLETPSLRSAVFFPGMLTGEAKWGAFWGCEAFVLPSHQENFGIAVVEAMACGKSVLISDQVNIWREIEADGGGIIEPDSLEGTQKMLNSWINKSAEEKKNSGKGARNSFEKKFGIGSAARQLLEVVQN